MKTLINICLISALLISSVYLSAQEGVSINDDGSPPHESAILDVQASDRGFLPPRMTEAQRNLISSPAVGLVIFNLTTNCTNIYGSTGWYEICGECTPEPIQADAGPDQIYVDATSTTLEANDKGSAFTGTWSVVSSTNTYSFDGGDVNNPNVVFNGEPGSYYTLQWEISNACGSTTDEVEISFEYVVNPLCENATISTTPCSAVTGAVQNNNPATPIGNEYDWTDATSTIIGIGIGAPTHERALVEIGGQCWTRFNVNIENTNLAAWSGSNTGAAAWSGYFNDGTSEINAGDGRLYQWRAAMNGSETERAQGVCPDGWHIPSDCEWMYLEDNLGMLISDQIKMGGVYPPGSSAASSNPTFRGNYGDGTSTGSQLSVYPPDGNNNSGFTAMMSGFRSTSSGGLFNNHEDRTFFWTSTMQTSTQAVSRQIRSNASEVRGVGRFNHGVATSYSVRCLKD